MARLMRRRDSTNWTGDSPELDTTVLQFQNQKLNQKLETQKIEISSLRSKLSREKEKENLHDQKLACVKKSWARLVGGLESTSLDIRGGCTSDGKDINQSAPSQDGSLSTTSEITFQRCLMQTGATESCSMKDNANQVIVEERACEMIESIVDNSVVAVDDVWALKDKLSSALSVAAQNSDSCRQRKSNDLASKVKNMRSALVDLHLKHKTLARDMWNHQDTSIKNRVELKNLRADLESTLKDLEENNHQLVVLKAEKDTTKGSVFPVLSSANKHTAGDASTNKQKDLQDMEHYLEKIMGQSSSRLEELKRLHEERIVILKKLLEVQSTLKNMKIICSSHAFEVVSKQLEMSKAELAQFQALYEKLQAERDTLSWHERQAIINNDLADVLRRSCTVADSRIHDLGVEIQKHIDGRKQIEAMLEKSSNESGRDEVISKFKALNSSFPEDMNIMQSQLSKHKELAADVHSLRADVHSLRNVLDRKEKELETLSIRSASQQAEMQELQAAVRSLKQINEDLSLFVEMYKREHTLTSDVSSARDLEFTAWAHVEGLRSSLDERNLEYRVKEAIEAEAISQQTLAAAESDIAHLREKLEVSERELTSLSDVLKSKSGENEAYISEIETIGQAYDDMQKQNQQLLQQITERDNYNIKLVLEGVKARQRHDALLVEKTGLEKNIQQANLTSDFYEMKASRIENQVKLCSDLVKRQKEDRHQMSDTLEAIQSRSHNAKKMVEQGRETLEILQSKVNESRARLANSRIERDKERFEKKRLQEQLEALKRKASELALQLDGSSTVGKLRQELKSYKDILNCNLCHERAKEVVITKCYHLLCEPCVKKILESRQRKCPICSASFTPNDVKPVYI